MIKYLIHWMPECSGGLCDRLLGICSTLCIANKMNMKLLIKWDHTDLSSGFVINSEYNYYTYNVPYKYVYYNSESGKDYYLNNNLVEEWKDENILIWSNQNFYQYFIKNKHLQILRTPSHKFDRVNFSRTASELSRASTSVVQPMNSATLRLKGEEKGIGKREMVYDLNNNEYLNDINNMVKLIFTNIFKFNNTIMNEIKNKEYDIGIHIRTHDNQIYDKNKSNYQEEYIKKILLNIREYLDYNQIKNKTIFIASDNILSYKLANGIFNNKIYQLIEYTGEIIHSGGEQKLITENGLNKVLIDLNLLGQSKLLFIGWDTNFSRIASMINLKRNILRFESGNKKIINIENCDKIELCNYFSNAGFFRS
jgi:hypothetical protein